MLAGERPKALLAQIVRREVREHGGFEVKVQDDGLMIALPSARRAAQCELVIQRAIQAELAKHPARRH